jgi:holo-[acyl-carrier protein] synthase
MIFGVGIDLCSIDRIESAYVRFGVRFACRILTAAELELFADNRRQIRFLAMRFAAKEAFAKALGTGFKQKIFPAQIGVAQAPSGKPSLYLLGEAYRRTQLIGVHATHVSLTDEGSYVAAVVVLETG